MFPRVHWCHRGETLRPNRSHVITLPPYMHCSGADIQLVKSPTSVSENFERVALERDNLETEGWRQ